MMKNQILAILLIILPFRILSAQELKVGIEVGDGSYAMKDLKKLNDILIESLPFSSKVVSDFPSYLYFEPKIILSVGRFDFGAVFSFQSTGSRISTKDYSGEYRFDMAIKSNAPGVYVGFHILSREKNELSFYLKEKGNYSKLRITEYFSLYEDVLSDVGGRFSTRNYSLEPGVSYTRSFGFFSIGLNLGYSFNFGKNNFTIANMESYPLFNPVTNSPVKADWSGFRAGLSALININKVFKHKKA
jgi:hypothetical protein